MGNHTHDGRFARLLERKLSPRLENESTIAIEFLGWDRSGPIVARRFKCAETPSSSFGWDGALFVFLRPRLLTVATGGYYETESCRPEQQERNSAHCQHHSILNAGVRVPAVGSILCPHQKNYGEDHGDGSPETRDDQSSR
jgi:hypothetical protein